MYSRLCGKVWAGVGCIFNLLSLVLCEIIWWKNTDFYVFFHVFLADAYWDFHFLSFSVKWKVVQFMWIFFGKDTLNTDWPKTRKTCIFRVFPIFSWKQKLPNSQISLFQHFWFVFFAQLFTLKHYFHFTKKCKTMKSA